MVSKWNAVQCGDVLYWCTLGPWNTTFALVFAVIWNRCHIYSTDISTSQQWPHTESVPKKYGKCPKLIFNVDSRWKNNTGPVRLCYYTMEMRPFWYEFGNEMISMRSYFQSIMRHTATDWINRFHVISKWNAVDCTDGLDFVELYKYLTTPRKRVLVSRYKGIIIICWNHMTGPMQSLSFCVIIILWEWGRCNWQFTDRITSILGYIHRT